MLVSIHRIESREHHGLDFFEAGQRFDRRALVVGDRVANLGVGDVLDIRDKEAYFAGHQFFDFDRLGRQHADGFHLENPAVRP